VSLIVGANNGWNVTDLSTSGSKTGEFGATWAPNKMLSFATTGYIGKVADGVDLSLIDFVGTYNVTSALTVILNADAYQLSGMNSSHTHINGFAAYANYGFTDSLRTSVRMEYVNYVGLGHAVEGTVTIGYSPVKNFEIRGELRYDSLSNGAFNNGISYLRAFNNSAETETLANNNSEFAIQGVYKFSLP
jgi:hypothetical protein